MLLKIAGCGIEIFDSYFPPWKLLIHFLLREAELPEHTKPSVFVGFGAFFVCLRALYLIGKTVTLAFRY